MKTHTTRTKKNKFNIGDLISVNEDIGIIFNIKTIEEAKLDPAVLVAAAAAAAEWAAVLAAETALDALCSTMPWARRRRAAIQKDPRIYYIHFNDRIRCWDAYDMCRAATLSAKLNK